MFACRDAARRHGKLFAPLMAREERIEFRSTVVAVPLLIWERRVTAFTMFSGFVNSLLINTFKVKFAAFKDSQLRIDPGY